MAELGGVRGVVASDADHLAARDDRRQQSHVGEAVLLLEDLDPHVEGVAGQGHDDRVLGRLAELVDLAGDDAELGFLADGESRDAHPVSLSTYPWLP